MTPEQIDNFLAEGNTVKDLAAALDITPIEAAERFGLVDRFVSEAANAIPEQKEPEKSYDKVLDNYSISEETEAEYAKLKEIQKKKDVGLAREVAGGLTMQLADELEAAISDEEYDVAKARIDAERAEYQRMNPALSLTAEVAGAIPTSILGAAGLARAGVTRLGTQGAAEAGFYEFNRGNTLEERVIGGTVGAIFGGFLGKGMERLTGRAPVPAVSGRADDILGFEQKEIVNYTKSDGSTVMAKIIGEENGQFVLTTSIANDSPPASKMFRVDKGDDVITKRDDIDIDDPSLTPIERVPEGEEAPYSVLGDEPYQPITLESSPAIGPGKPRQKIPLVSFGNTRLSTKTQEAAKKLAADILPDLNGTLRVISASEWDRALTKNRGDIEAAKKELKLPDNVVNNIVKNSDRIFNALDNSGIRGTSFGNGTVFINDLGDDALGAANTLFHEIGHEAAQLKLGKELRRHIGNWSLDSRYNNKAGKFSPKPTTVLGKEIAAEWRTQYHAIKDAYSNYPERRLFDEWLADNISMWHTKNTLNVKPKTKLETWFSQQAKNIKTMWEKLNPYRVERMSVAEQSESLSKFFDDFAARNRKFVEGAPPRADRVVPDGPIQRSGSGRVVTQRFREAPRTQFTETLYGPETGPSWRDAKTAGELFDGIKAGLKRTYDRLTPMTDLLQRRVSREVGARAQRADETATRQNQLDFENYVQPIEDVAKQYDENEAFRKATLLFSEGSISRKEFLSFIKSEFGAKEAANMNKYIDWSARKNAQYNQEVSGTDKRANYLHRQRKYQNETEANAAIDEEFALPLDAGSKKRTINVSEKLKYGDKSILDYYQNPFFTNSRRIMNNNKLIQYAEKFGVRGDTVNNTPEAILAKIADSIESRGISRDRADFAIQEIRRNLLGERKMMNQVLQAFQTLGYAGSLAGPKSALLNIHDIPQAAVNQGPAALRAWTRSILRDKNGKVLSDSFGFSQQAKFGEFANSLNQSLATRGGMAKSLNATANATTNALMKVSLFQAMDKVGKGGVLRVVQQKAVDDVAKDGWQGLKPQWGSYFSDGELKKIAKDLTKHGMDDAKYSDEGLRLIEEMMVAGLGQQQLISAGGRPAFWADHPNARVFLALRGFAMKQQAVALRNTLQNAQEGNTKEAADWAMRYALYSMGGFAVINEGRQMLFGDGDPKASRVVRSFFDQLVGVASLNSASVSDYSWGKLQRGEFLSYVLDNNIPIAVGVPADAVEDVFDTLTGEKPLSQLPDTLPLVKQSKNLMQNIEEANEPKGMLTGE